MNSVSERIAELEQALSQAQAQRDAPERLAEELAQAKDQEREEQATRQRYIVQYISTVYPKHQQSIAALQARRKELTEQYAQVQSQLDELIAGVKAYEQDVHSVIKEATADRVTFDALSGQHQDPQFSTAILASLGFSPQHEDMLQLVNLVASMKFIYLFASRHVSPVTTLDSSTLSTGRFIRGYAEQVKSRLPDPQQRVQTWGVDRS